MRQHRTARQRGEGRTSIERYRDSGNRRPTLNALNNVRAHIEGQRDSSFDSRLVLADVFVDLAVAEPDNSTEYIDLATDTLDVVIKDLEGLADNHPVSFARQSPDLVTAYLRRAELTNWLSAATGRQTTPNYGSLLNAAEDVAGLVSLNPDARSRVIEFLPVLLGARSLTNGAGWIGRLSLDREDHRPILDPNSNPNWDVGICATADPYSYIQPEIRIDMKSSKPNKSRLKRTHAAAGIGVISAKACGLDDPEGVIWSCIKEADGSVPVDVSNLAIFSAGQLNDITATIASRLPDPVIQP